MWSKAGALMGTAMALAVGAVVAGVPDAQRRDAVAVLPWLLLDIGEASVIGLHGTSVISRGDGEVMYSVITEDAQGRRFDHGTITSDFVRKTIASETTDAVIGRIAGEYHPRFRGVQMGEVSIDQSLAPAAAAMVTRGKKLYVLTDIGRPLNPGPVQRTVQCTEDGVVKWTWMTTMKGLLAGGDPFDVSNDERFLLADTTGKSAGVNDRMGVYERKKGCLLRVSFGGNGEGQSASEGEGGKNTREGEKGVVPSVTVVIRDWDIGAMHFMGRGGEMCVINRNRDMAIILDGNGRLLHRLQTDETNPKGRRYLGAGEDRIVGYDVATECGVLLDAHGQIRCTFPMPVPRNRWSGWYQETVAFRKDLLVVRAGSGLQYYQVR